MNPQRQHILDSIKEEYKSALDSVNLINAISAQTKITAEDVQVVVRNVAHLKIMLAEPFWTTEDLSSIKAASLITVKVK